jgi:hypothetical protein
LSDAGLRAKNQTPASPLEDREMSSRDPREHQHPQPPRREFWLLVAVAALIATIALLHLAVQRERAAGFGALDFQLLSGSPAGSALETTSEPRESR